MDVKPTEQDLKTLKAAAKLLFDAVPLGNLEDYPFGIIPHPYTDSNIVMNKNKELVDIFEQKHFREFRDMIFANIDKWTVDNILTKVFILIRDAYYLTFLMLCEGNISVDVFSEMLAYAWVNQENPNGDANVSVKQLVSWFAKANKEVLMEQEDLEHYNNLPETLTLYRGVMKGHNIKGLSYTQNRDKALWFANRFDTEDKKLIAITVPKSLCLCYFNTRNEDEVVVNTTKLFKNKAKYNYKIETI